LLNKAVKTHTVIPNPYLIVLGKLLVTDKFKMYKILSVVCDCTQPVGALFLGGCTRIRETTSYFYILWFHWGQISHCNIKCCE